MNLFVDTIVWSLAWRRDDVPSTPEISALRQALDSGDAIYSTGLVLQELLQGFSRPKAHGLIIEHFRSLPLLVPDRRDHIEAADLRNACRRAGVQVGTIDALLAQLCIRHELTMLSSDHDFQRIATVVPLSNWR